MKMKFRAAVGSLLVSGLLAGAAVVPAAGQASEVGILASPGQVCNLAHDSAVSSTPNGGTILYFLYVGYGFRIVSYGPSNTYYGRGNGLPEGYISRDVINQSSCHWD